MARLPPWRACDLGESHSHEFCLSSQIKGSQQLFFGRSFSANANIGCLCLNTLLSVPHFDAILCRNSGKLFSFRTRKMTPILHPHPPCFWGHDCPETTASRAFQAHRVAKKFLFFFGCMPSTCVLLSRPSLGRNASRHRKMAGPLKSLEFEVSGQEDQGRVPLPREAVRFSTAVETSVEILTRSAEITRSFT